MRQPKACNVHVGNDGKPLGLIIGFRPGVHRSAYGPIRVVRYVPIMEKPRARSRVRA